MSPRVLSLVERQLSNRGRDAKSVEKKKFHCDSRRLCRRRSTEEAIRERRAGRGGRQKWWPLIDFFWIRTGRFRKKYLLSLQTINIGVRRYSVTQKSKCGNTRSTWISTELDIECTPGARGWSNIFFCCTVLVGEKNVSTSEWSLVANSKRSSARNDGECPTVIPVRNTRKIGLHWKLEASSDEYLMEICLEIFSCAQPNGADNFCKFLARHAWLLWRLEFQRASLLHTDIQETSRAMYQTCFSFISKTIIP